MPRKKKTEEQVMTPAVSIVETPLEEILADRFNRYSKHIIQERALPDARDGLKPVQRRILWAMWEAGNTWNHPYHKSAKTVGNVIGNYHPHGDSSVYEALVRMSQEWKIRTPLVDMQGNNGSIDDDPAAAMRYTEARLAEIANYLLEDIDKDTVEWAPNFSDEKLEPVVLPARYPNLLVNGITGIAAGYATNIPPHNLIEVLEAAIFRLDHPDSTLEELMQFVKGPDFPTGGIVMGMDGVRQALETGKGRFFIRSKAEIEETRTLQQIVITEIPYEVVKSSLVKRLDDIRLNHKVDGILDVRDESDRNGMRIVVDLKKEANAQAILNYFYKNTDLQISYTYNVVAIVNRSPVQMGLAAILDAFLAHREDVVIRRSQYELAGRQKRAHIVEGLIRAVSILDEIIALIRSSKNKADSKQRLMQTYEFTEMQAEAIVMLQLYRLSNTDILELEKEARKLEKEIRQLQSILTKPKVRHALMVREMEDMKNHFDVPRKTRLEEKAQEIVIDQKDMIAKEQVMVTLSKDGYVKRVSLRSYGAAKDMPTGLKDGDQLAGWGEASTLDTLLVITDRGKYALLPVYKLEENRWKDIGSHFSSYMKTDPQEKIRAAWLFSAPPERVEFVLATRQGMLKRIAWEDFPSFRQKTAGLINLSAEDELVKAVALPSSDTDVVVLTRQGNAKRLHPMQIPASSAKTKGVKGGNYQEDQILTLLDTSRPEALLIPEQSGLKRINLEQIPLLGRQAKGEPVFRRLKTRPEDLQDAWEIFPEESLLFWDGQTMEEHTGLQIPLKELKAALPAIREDFGQYMPVLPKLEPGSWSREEELIGLEDGEKEGNDGNLDTEDGSSQEPGGQLSLFDMKQDS